MSFDRMTPLKRVNEHHLSTFVNLKELIRTETGSEDLVDTVIL